MWYVRGKIAGFCILGGLIGLSSDGWTGTTIALFALGIVIMFFPTKSD